MANQNYNNSAESACVYPDHNIDPQDKGYEWMLQFTKAGWGDAKSYLGNTLYFGANRYREIRRYGGGNQSVNKYKRIYGIDEQNNDTFMTVDWSPVAIAAKYREIAISIIAQKMYDFEIFAVDPLSKSEEDIYFTQLQLRMQMRQMAEQMNLPIKNFPQFKKQAGDPEDEEELAIKQGYGFKHNLAMEAELGCSYVHQINDSDEARLRTAANLFDFGWGGYKDWIDDTGMARYREVNPENFVCSYCVHPDFRDMTHGGEVIEVMLVDLVPYFDTEQMKVIAKTACGQYGNPSSYSLNKTSSSYFGNFKVHVWDVVFYSWNKTVYRNEINKAGNLSVNKTDYQNGRESMKSRTIDFQGTKIPEFMEANRKVVYKMKWIVGTEFGYDWGLMENQKRNKDTWYDTTLPYRMYSWNMIGPMQFSGITERLIPIIDDWHKTYFKLQDLKNKLMPYIMNLNLSALEAAGFAGKAGGKMKPDEIIDFLLQNFVAPFRETDLLSKSSHGKVAWFEGTGQLEVIMQYRNELLSIEQLFASITGLNDVTNGSTVDARSLTTTVNAQITSTNNCLYLVARAEKKLYQKNTEAIVSNIQLAVQNGKFEGYVKALGMDTIQYFQVSKDVALRKFGLFVTDAPTPQEKQMFAQELQIKDANGLIEPEDKIIIMSCRNLKQAAELLAYKLKKRREAAQQFELKKITANNESQGKIAMDLEQTKHKNSMELIAAQIQVEIVKGQWNYETEMMKKGLDIEEGAQQAQAKVIAAKIMADAKIDSTHIQSGSQLVKTHMDNETAKETAKHKKTA